MSCIEEADGSGHSYARNSQAQGYNELSRKTAKRKQNTVRILCCPFLTQQTLNVSIKYCL